jgi:type II secretory pathway pseudopilin PulG
MVNGKSKLQNQRGATFIEIIIYISLLGIFLGIVIPLLTGGKDTATVNLEVTQMRSSLDRIDNRYFGEPITDDLDNEQMIDGKLIAASYRTSGSSIIYNQFDGLVEVNGVSENGLTWSTEGIPSDVCVEFVQQGRQLGFLDVAVGGTSLQYSQTNVSDITDACVGAAGTSDTVDIVFTRPNA